MDDVSDERSEGDEPVDRADLSAELEQLAVVEAELAAAEDELEALDDAGDPPGTPAP